MTTTVADLFTPEYVAVMLLRVVALTVFVFTEKFVEDRFAGTITEAGTSAAEFALTKLTTAPFTGAGRVRITAPIADWPPATLEGLTVTEFNAAGSAVRGL